MGKSKFEITDKTEQALADIENATEVGLERAAIYAQDQIVRAMPKNAQIEAGDGGWVNATPKQRSKPGNPPMQQTGRLARNIITGKIGRLRYGVGTRKSFAKAPYGFFLDQGTSKMSRRPWLGATIRRKWKGIQAQFEKGFEHAIGGDE